MGAQGYLVRTMADPPLGRDLPVTAAEAALASGAHSISTDFPAERHRLPGKASRR